MTGTISLSSLRQIMATTPLKKSQIKRLLGLLDRESQKHLHDQFGEEYTWEEVVEIFSRELGIESTADIDS